MRPANFRPRMKQGLLLYSSPPLSLNPLPAQTPATNGALMSIDGFNLVELGSAWRISTPTFAIAGDALMATQTHPQSANFRKAFTDWEQRNKTQNP